MSRFVDPFMMPLLEQMQAAPAVDYAAMPIAEARRVFEAGARPWQDRTPEAAIRDLVVPGAAGPLRARLFLPPAVQPPLTVYVHGGGWTFGSVDTHDGEMARLALASGCAVLGFDYRLAPEHPFPAGLDDALAVIHHAETGGLGEAVDAGSLTLAGDSAGANIALAALLARREQGAAAARAAVLYYGCYDPDFATPSHARLGDGRYGLSTQRMRWYWSNVLGAAAEAPPPFAAPLRADLSDLPPLYLAVGSLDPLLDDTLNLSRRLAHQGIAHRCDLVAGVNHGFLRMARELPVAVDTIASAGAFLAGHTKQSPSGGNR